MSQTFTKSELRQLLVLEQGLRQQPQWSGIQDTQQALNALGSVQLDPLIIVARSHDLVLRNRVEQYHPDHLIKLVYENRLAFEYGGLLAVHPIEQLPYWLHHMQARQQDPTYLEAFTSLGDNGDGLVSLIDELGPMSSRQIANALQLHGATHEETPTSHGGSYRSQSTISRALYQLWLGGRLMTHHRDRFERVYALPQHVGPEQFLQPAPAVEMEAFFAGLALHKAVASTLTRFRSSLGYYLHRPVSRQDAQLLLDRLQDEGVAMAIAIEDTKGTRQTWFVASVVYQRLRELQSGDSAHDRARNAGEVTLLSPLDPLVDRERARIFFDFEHVWEIYKPPAKRRWGPFTMPILYGAELVGRIDARHDRERKALVVNGLWVEQDAVIGDETFAEHLIQALVELARFVGAGEVLMRHMEPKAFAFPQSLLV